MASWRCISLAWQFITPGNNLPVSVRLGVFLPLNISFAVFAGMESHSYVRGAIPREAAYYVIWRDQNNRNSNSYRRRQMPEDEIHLEFQNLAEGSWHT